MQWVKLHVDILGDAKLMTAEVEGARHLLLLPWLLAFAMKSRDRGRISVRSAPADPRIIAAGIPNATPKAVAAAMHELTKIGVLVTDPDGVSRFANWDKRAERASDRPESITERVRRHRERKRDGNESETHLKRVAPPLRNGVEGEGEGEGEEEGEGEGEEERANNNNHARGEFAEGLLGYELTTDLLAHVRHQRSAWSQTITDVAAGVPGFMLSPAQIRSAVTDYLANGETPSLGRFRGYLQRAAATPLTSSGPRSSGRTTPTIGERARANAERALASRSSA